MDTQDYKALFEQSSALVVVVDTQFTMVAASDEFLKATKTIRENIIDKNIFDVFPDNPNDITANGESTIRASFNRVIQNKTAETLAVVKYDIPKPESEGGGFKPKYWRPCHSPVFDAFNKVKYIIQRVEDVTENEALIERFEIEKKALKRIEESNKRYYTMLLQSPFAFSIMKGKDMVITLANDLIKEFWGKGKNVEGKTLLQVLPELKDQPFPAMLDEVFTTGTPVYASEIRAQLQYKNKLEDKYFNIVYQPYYEADETISGVTTIAYDVTEMVLARKKVEESEYRYHNLIYTSPSLIAIFKGADMIIEIANDAILESWGKGKSIIGKSLFEAIPETIEQGFDKMLLHVYRTGEPTYAYETPITLIKNGKPQLIYYTFIYQAQRDRRGKIEGVAVLANEATAQVEAKNKLIESEKRLRNLVEQSPMPILILKGEDMVMEVANEPMFKIFNVGKEALGKPFLDIIPEMKDQPFIGWLSDVFHKGVTHHGNEEPAYFIRENGEKETIYFNFVYQPYHEDDGSISGVVVLANDVTEQFLARKRIEESESHFRQLADLMPAKISNANAQGNVLYFNKQWLDFTGFDFEELKDFGYHQIMHPEELEEFQKRLQTAGETGTVLAMEMRFLNKEGEYKWHLNLASPVKDENGNIKMWVGSTTHIHEQKMTAQKIKASEERFWLLVTQAPVAIMILKGAAYTIEIANDFYLQMVEKEAAFIGKPIFESLPELESQGIRQLLDKIMQTGIPFYGNEVEVQMSRDEKRSQGFYNFVYHPIREADGTITRIMIVANEVTEQVLARDKIVALQHLHAKELEEKIQQRTAELRIANESLERKNEELQLMNKELEAFTYVSSHDLQEPLRKIQTFASYLLEKEKENLSGKGKDYFQRMQSTANQMQTLIEDLLAYSRTSITERKFQNTDLNLLLEEVKIELKEALAEKHATIEATKLGSAHIIPFQFRQLLYNLISNALKFSKPENPPHIIIKNNFVKGSAVKNQGLSSEKNYCHITITDNGIGFEPEFKNRIFEVFQKLHGKEEYAGTGIGLAIVKKIVDNHYGVITATSELNNGATFDIYIPTL